MTLTFDEIEEASVRWPPAVPDSRRSQKVRCPDCGATGYPRGSWTHNHRYHEPCPDCGKTVTVGGMSTHRAGHRRWKNL